MLKWLESPLSQPPYLELFLKRGGQSKLFWSGLVYRHFKGRPSWKNCPVWSFSFTYVGTRVKIWVEWSIKAQVCSLQDNLVFNYGFSEVTKINVCFNNNKKNLFQIGGVVFILFALSAFVMSPEWFGCCRHWEKDHTFSDKISSNNDLMSSSTYTLLALIYYCCGQNQSTPSYRLFSFISPIPEDLKILEQTLLSFNWTDYNQKEWNASHGSLSPLC